jgi:spore maturation protein CgeB
VVADGIWGARYPLALACSKIALGLLSKRIPETTTTRSFEIPAMGVFMLAERTDDHLALFREGIEAEFFGSDDELHEKIGFYLSHDNARRKIAAAGRDRCVQSGYAARSQIEKVLARLASLGS